MRTTTKLELRPISQLIPYANNARTHSEAQIDKLRRSLREFGFVAPVLIDGKDSNYLSKIVWDHIVAPTLVSGSDFLRAYDKTWYSEQDCINVQTFPQDYQFLDQNVKYICGMSVPPVMMAQIASEIDRQWLSTLGGGADG